MTDLVTCSSSLSALHVNKQAFKQPAEGQTQLAAVAHPDVSPYPRATTRPTAISQSLFFFYGLNSSSLASRNLSSKMSIWCSFSSLQKDSLNINKYLYSVSSFMLVTSDTRRTESEWVLSHCGGGQPVWGNKQIHKYPQKGTQTRFKAEMSFSQPAVHTRISSNNVPWSTFRNSWSQTGMSSVRFSLFSSSSGGGGSSLWWVHHWITCGTQLSLIW